MVAALLDRLRRVTNGRPWIPEIDGLRFVAIASVVLFHLAGELTHRSGRLITIEPRYWLIERWLSNAGRGVRLFFVISGLVLALPFARHFLDGAKPVSLRAFYLRRVTRLEPPYVVSLLLFIALFSIYTHSISREYLHHAIASLFYLHNMIYADLSPVNMVTWSLEVEVQFYLVAPLAMQIFRLRQKIQRRLTLLVLMVASAGFQASLLHYPRLQLSALFYAEYFLAGLLLADVFIVDLPAWREHWGWDLAAAGSGVVLFSFGRDWLPAHAILPFVLMPLCLAAMRGPITRRCLAAPWVAVLGGMCYSIYLMHFIFIAVFFKVTRHLIVARFDYLANYLIQCLVLIPSVLAVSVAFFLLIERPCMDPRWPTKLWHYLVSMQRERTRDVVAKRT